MHASRPTMAQFVFEGAASKIQPRFVKKNGLPVRIPNNDHYRGRIGHVPEPLLTFTQFVLALLELDTIFLDSLQRLVQRFQNLSDGYGTGQGDLHQQGPYP
jgi:hypothetical protein